MRKQIVSSLIALIGLGGLHAQSVYFADGYHGGVFGHYPKWQTAFMMDKLKENPGWRINLELEPETFDSVKVWAPDTYREFQQFLAKEDGRLIEFTNPTYSQPYCYNISGESLIRQFSYGMNLLRAHFPTLSFHTYAVEEPCFTSALPQILRLFGFRYAVLKNPDTCYGGYMVAYGDDLVNWIGPDSTQMLTVPRYSVEKLEDNSTWQTTAWNNSSKYLNACKEGGIKNPVGMCYQDAGWKNGPWLGAPEKASGTYTLWTDYLNRIAGKQAAKDWRVSQEDVLVSLMWGSQVLQKLSQEIRVTEQKLVQTEKIATLQKYYDRKAWDDKAFDRAWRNLLMSQHHDCWIVPYNNMGSTGKTWAENVRLYTTESNGICDRLIAPQQTDNSNIRVYNTTGTDRKELVHCKINAPWNTTPFVVKNRSGKTVPYQRISADEIVFLADVPAMGYTSFSLKEGKASKSKETQTQRLANNHLLVENDLYRIEIAPEKGGTIVSLYNKKENKEWIDSGAGYAFNELRGNFYEEGGFLSSASTPANVSVETDGALMTTVSVRGKIGRHPFTQYLTLKKGEPRIDCRLVIDWQGNSRIGERKETSKMQEVRKTYYDDRYKLHLLFPVLSGNRLIYKNAPFDVCESKLQNTFFNRWDSIKNNVILNWVDLYDKQNDRAFCLFTDHTTSYLHGEDYPLGLTVQYSGGGLWGRDYAIKEQTEINYSFLPHSGMWDKAHISFENAKRDEPLVALYEASDHPSASLLSTPDKDLLLSTAYYDGNDLIVRLYNEGASGTKTFALPFTPASVEEINLENEKIKEYACKTERNRQVLSFHIPQFGMKTFRIKQY